MYLLVLDEGIVIRESDGVVVAPCQSDADPGFCKYVDWVMVEKNEPKVIETRTSG